MMKGKCTSAIPKIRERWARTATTSGIAGEKGDFLVSKEGRERHLTNL